MIKKIYKLKTEDYKLPYKNIYNGEFLNIRVHIYNDKNIDIINSKTNNHNRYGININKKISSKSVNRNRMRRIIFNLLKEIEQQKKENNNGIKKENNSIYILILKKTININNLEKIKEELKVFN